MSRHPQEFFLGFELQEATRDKIAKRLAFIAELSHGDFSHRLQSGCTVFIAPRELGVERFSRVRCYLSGVSDALTTY